MGPDEDEKVEGDETETLEEGDEVEGDETELVPLGQESDEDGLFLSDDR